MAFFCGTASGSPSSFPRASCKSDATSGITPPSEVSCSVKTLGGDSLNQKLLLALAVAICGRAQNSYSVHRLVSDLPGMAEHYDANLKNPWGLSASGTSPFWI